MTSTSGPDFHEVATSDKYGWIVKKQTNGSYLIAYTNDAANTDLDNPKYRIKVQENGTEAEPTFNFQCYNKDATPSNIYYEIYLGSCENRWWSSNPGQLTYTVTFNLNGESGTAPAAITGLTAGSTITAPTAPTSTCSTFGGWYRTPSCTGDAWDFTNDVVNSSMTL